MTETTAEPAPDQRPGGSAVSRRFVLSALAALGIGVAVQGELAQKGAAPPPPPPPPGGSPLLRGQVVDVRAVGAAGDGRADDGEAIRRGLDAANAVGGTLFFPAGLYRYPAATPLRPAAGLTISGEPGRSTVAFDHGGASDYVSFLEIGANDVTVDGITVRRYADFRTVLISLGPVRNFTLSRSALVGHQDTYRTNLCHGIKFPDAGSGGGISITDSTVSTVTYGLLQDNISTAEMTGVTVTRSTFTGNANTDLEFNSPRGSIRQIRVDGCTFADNDSPGFAVGLAHVRDAALRGNTFSSYALEAVHIEDYSQDVLVQDNQFRACGLRDYSHVQIISGSRRVRVIGNSFDAAMNTRPIYVVNALPGGDWPTAGDRPPSGPFDVEVRDNRFVCAAPVVPIYFQQVAGGSITDNTVTAPAAGTPAEAFRLLEDPGSTVSGNLINGRRQ